MAERRIRGVSQNSLEKALQAHMLAEVNDLTVEEVISELREEGITSLEDLVRTSLDEVQGARDPAAVSNTFIAKQIIYKDDMPVPDSVIRALTQIRRPGG